MHIDIHPHAEADLDQLWRTDSNAAAYVVALVEQFEADSNIVDKLTTNNGEFKFGAVPINVKQWGTAQRRRANLWRCRIVEPAADNYRVVYGYHWQTRAIVILAIVARHEINYDNLRTDLNQRILRDWNDLP